MHAVPNRGNAPRTEDAATATTPPAGISALVARVLDQLSLSAWLPSALLVAGLFLLAKLRFNRCGAYETFADVADTRASTLVILSGLVVLLTTVTQAFEFGAIRLLEGYWGHYKPGDWLARAFLWVPSRRRRSSSKRRQEYRRAAFDTARAPMLQAGVAPELVAYFAAVVRQEPLPSLSQAHSESVKKVDWRHFASTAAMRRLDEFDRTSSMLPRSHRVLPTKLGNTLRSYEDKANVLLRGSVTGMVQRSFHLLPAHVQTELDQNRNRIGLYATLVVIASALGSTGWVVLRSVETTASLIALASGLLSARVFYRAAVSSAAAYGSLLVVAAELAAERQNRPTS